VVQHLQPKHERQHEHRVTRSSTQLASWELTSIPTPTWANVSGWKLEYTIFHTLSTSTMLRLRWLLEELPATFREDC